MDKTDIGKSGVKISSIGLGGGNWGREVDENTSFELMDYAFENGITLFDTGDLYGGGQSFAARKEVFGTEDQRETTLEMYSSEKIIGRWLKSRGCRDQVTLCTKVGSGGTPENIKKSLERSLNHFDTDYVDIYKLHRPYDDVPLDETIGAMAEEVYSRRTRVIGAANHSVLQVIEALKISDQFDLPGFQVLQLPYSIVLTDIENDLLPLFRKEKLAVTAYSPLAAGFLSGKYVRDPDKWPKGSRYHIMPSHADQYFSDRNFRILDLLKELEVKIGVPGVQLAIAWALANQDVTSVLIGARNKKQIDNAVNAFESGISANLRDEMSNWV